jgi:hypothetical protein
VSFQGCGLRTTLERLSGFLCRQENAGIFINAIGGRALYEKKEFESNGVDLYFVEAQPFTYPQRTPTFVPDLSIIDVLMNCGKEGSKELLETLG